MDMTLREIHDAFGISRRAIQGYEKAGLVRNTGKNERGHLLYDEEEQMRIKKIRLFQQMGFSICEIKDMIDAPDNVLKPIMKQQLIKMKKEQVNIKILIDKMNDLIKEL